MIKTIYSLRKSFRTYPQENRMMILYRYISLLVTSYVFLVGNYDSSIFRKLFIVVCISISTVIINYLIIKNHQTTTNIKILVFIETIGISLILIPTGGVRSPYIWYAINTILVSSVELNHKYCWITLFVYLFSAIIIPYCIFKSEKFLVFSVMLKESNLIISLLLITLAIQMLTDHIKTIQTSALRLSQTNEELLIANQNARETMNYVMELYQAVHLFSLQTDKKDLIKLIMQYTKKITKSDTVLYCPVSQTESKIIINHEGVTQENLFYLKNEIMKINKAGYLEKPTLIYINKKAFVLATIKSNYCIHGTLGIEIPISEEQTFNKNKVEQLQFLSEVGSMVLERFELDDIKNKLVIREEQNRIANEIHDNVLQKLFSISCGLYTITKKPSDTQIDQISKELNVIRKSMDIAMQDLRATIYGLSWRKNGVNNFQKDIKNYIDEIKKLNNVNIEFEFCGNPELLTSYHKKAIYRIICESIGNALCHGKAKHIDINIQINKTSNLLKISDNGSGFDTVKTKNSGIGLKNMNALVSSLNGSVMIDSDIGKGTSIVIEIPNDLYNDKRELVN